MGKPLTQREAAAQEEALDRRIEESAAEFEVIVAQADQEALDALSVPNYEAVLSFIRTLKRQVTSEGGDWHRWYAVHRGVAERARQAKELLKLLDAVAGPSRAAERLQGIGRRFRQLLYDNFVPVGFKKDR